MDIIGGFVDKLEANVDKLGLGYGFLAPLSLQAERNRTGVITQFMNEAAGAIKGLRINNAVEHVFKMMEPWHVAKPTIDKAVMIGLGGLVLSDGLGIKRADALKTFALTTALGAAAYSFMYGLHWSPQENISEAEALGHIVTEEAPRGDRILAIQGSVW